MDTASRILAAACIAALAYTLVGYPVLMAALARIRPRPVRREEVSPLVTIIIAAHNEADVIARKIENTLALDYPAADLDVVVVDDGSTDDTASIAERWLNSGVRLLRQEPRHGKSTAGMRGSSRPEVRSWC